MITRYDFMHTIKDASGKEWPDCLSFPPSKKFIHKDPDETVLIREQDCYRFDLFYSDLRQTNNMEDVFLWLNHIPSRRSLEPGMVLQSPSQSDMNSFYIKNRV